MCVCRWMCSLKFNPDPSKPEVFESGPNQDWVSGYLPNVKSLASPPPNSPPPPPAPPPRAPCVSAFTIFPLSCRRLLSAARTVLVHLTRLRAFAVGLECFSL